MAQTPDFAPAPFPIEDDALKSFEEEQKEFLQMAWSNMQAYRFVRNKGRPDEEHIPFNATCIKFHHGDLAVIGSCRTANRSGWEDPCLNFARAFLCAQLKDEDNSRSLQEEFGIAEVGCLNDRAFEVFKAKEESKWDESISMNEEARKFWKKFCKYCINAADADTPEPEPASPSSVASLNSSLAEARFKLFDTIGKLRWSGEEPVPVKNRERVLVKWRWLMEMDVNNIYGIWDKVSPVAKSPVGSLSSGSRDMSISTGSSPPKSSPPRGLGSGSMDAPSN